MRTSLSPKVWRRIVTKKKKKCEGGLGFRDLANFNDALLAKQGWRILQNPQALWVQVLKVRYFPNCSFLEARRRASPSWNWSSLLSGRSLIQQGLCSQIGNGSAVNIWHGSWIPNLPNYTLSTHAYVPHQRVYELIDLDFPRWNLASIAHLLASTEFHAIYAIKLSLDLNANYLIWPREKSGKYSVCYMYHFSHSSTSRFLTHHPKSPTPLIKWTLRFGNGFGRLILSPRSKPSYGVW